MAKGKPQFSEDRRDEPAETGDFGFVPTEAAYEVVPTAARRQLTPRDEEHNLRVRTLFDRRIPGLPIDRDPPETRQDPEPFAALIERSLKRLNITASPWLDDLAQAWPRLVAPEIARVARPGKWDNGSLYIYVTSSTHLFELRRHHLKRIEEAVRAFPGGDRVRHVRLMVNSVSLP